ncbi:hypothetical protein [Deinococcus sp. QL22]|uniref:hypothetical protein n=1 Tax=Deinococcus sp. QL22 TaxID=2939437 RepID=UPI002016F79F|nr:hypothetical protein [Deinococcus sp. QL22]UQN09502.1 hypothetical protein M1R55_23430 [Deinococcus sp. QL22]
MKDLAREVAAAVTLHEDRLRVALGPQDGDGFVQRELARCIDRLRYVLKDSTTGKVCYRNQGACRAAPYITLSADSTTAGKETAVIHRPEEVAHVVFAACSAVENGVGSFAGYRPVAVFKDDLGQEVRTPVLGRNHFSFWVALFAVDLTGAEAKISHLGRYSSFGTERSPLLHASGKLEMNKGVTEFKGR